MHCADASHFTLLVPIMCGGPLNLDKELRLSDPLLLFHTCKGQHTHMHILTQTTGTFLFFITILLKMG